MTAHVRSAVVPAEHKAQPRSHSKRQDSAAKIFSPSVLWSEEKRLTLARAMWAEEKKIDPSGRQVGRIKKVDPGAGQMGRRKKIEPSEAR